MEATGSGLGRFLRTIISRVNALVVHCFRNLYPLSLIDASFVDVSGARIGARNFYPSLLLVGDDLDFGHHLGQVLVLAEDYCYVV